MNLNENIFIFPNFISKNIADYYIKIAKEKYDKNNGDIWNWHFRTTDITNDAIVNEVKNFLESKFPIKLTCDEAQTQVWFSGSSSELHIHTYNDREHGDFNSLIYLNEDFDGGEFITTNQSYKPKFGSLTFFNGKQIYHGVNKVLKNNRYTLIFWWKNTEIIVK